MVKLLIDYSNKNNIMVRLNEKNEDGYYPLLYSYYYNHIEMVKLLINYANNSNIIMEVNKKNNSGYYPLFYACDRNNIEMVKILIDYAYKNNIILEYKESYYENNSKIKSEIIEILKNYKKETDIFLPSLVIVINNFTAQEYNQMDIKKDEILVVTNWNCKKRGWVYGHRKDNKEEKGMFPKVFIKKCEREYIG